MAKGTSTYAFGASNREGHDASTFYNRNLYQEELPPLWVEGGAASPEPISVAQRPLAAWADRIYCASSTRMQEIPDNSVGLAITSPPYNVGKSYDDNLTMQEYFELIRSVGAEVYRTLKPGGRYLVNIANLGRKPYIPLTAYFYAIHMGLGFLPAGEIVWRKGKGMSGSCAWGSWRSAKAPRLRDLHEMVLVFTKERFDRAERGVSDVSSQDFMAGTLSVWEIAPESAKRVGHPAPFPVALADRAIKVFSYVDDVILDPFNGSGSTCVAAVQNGRHYVGYDISEEYCQLAERRIAEAMDNLPEVSHG